MPDITAKINVNTSVGPQKVSVTLKLSGGKRHFTIKTFK